MWSEDLLPIILEQIEKQQNAMVAYGVLFVVSTVLIFVAGFIFLKTIQLKNQYVLTFQETPKYWANTRNKLQGNVKELKVNVLINGFIFITFIGVSVFSGSQLFKVIELEKQLQQRLFYYEEEKSSNKNHFSPYNG